MRRNIALQRYTVWGKYPVIHSKFVLDRHQQCDGCFAHCRRLCMKMYEKKYSSVNTVHDATIFIYSQLYVISLFCKYSI